MPIYKHAITIFLLIISHSTLAASLGQPPEPSLQQQCMDNLFDSNMDICGVPSESDGLGETEVSVPFQASTILSGILADLDPATTAYLASLPQSDRDKILSAAGNFSPKLSLARQFLIQNAATLATNLDTSASANLSSVQTASASNNVFVIAKNQTIQEVRVHGAVNNINAQANLANTCAMVMTSGKYFAAYEETNPWAPCKRLGSNASAQGDTPDLADNIDLLRAALIIAAAADSSIHNLNETESLVAEIADPTNSLYPLYTSVESRLPDPPAGSDSSSGGGENQDVPVGVTP